MRASRFTRVKTGGAIRSDADRCRTPKPSRGRTTMKFKTIATLALAGLLASSLTACAAVEPVGSSTQASATQEAPVKAKKAKKAKKKPSMTRGQENALESAE